LTTTSGSSTSSTTGDPDEGGTQGEGDGDGDGDGDGEFDCAELDCGFGAGIENPDTSSSDPCVCDCDFGYTNSVEDGTCVLDESCFQVRTRECRTSVDEGSGVGMLFSLIYCNGEPKTDLDVDDVILEEIQLKDWEELLPAESAATIVDLDKIHHIYLVVDISASVKAAGLLPDLQTALTGFIDDVDAQGHPVRIALYAFDGAYSLYPVIPDTDDLAQASANMPTLDDLVAGDPLSTNLYGAVINGIIGNDRAQHKRKTASRRGLVTTGTVIVISDGDDEAGRKTLAEVETELDLSTNNIITVGLGAEENFPTLTSLGRDGALHADTPAQIATVFDTLAQRMDDFANSTFFLGYCSPKRGGTAQVRARFKDVEDMPGVEQEAVCEIDATFFDAGCGPDTFVEATACANRECGGVIGCGTCGAGQGCVGDTCVALLSAGAPPLVEDEACNDQAPCSEDPDNLACLNNICKVPAAIGEACTPGCDVPNAYCYNDGMDSTCQPTGGLGAFCDDPEQCLSQHCAGGGGGTVGSVCAERPPYREDCPSNTCEDGSYCPGQNSKCERLLYDWEECTSSKECRSGECGTFTSNHKACLPAGWANYDDSL
jgi:hypothetical protein